MKKKILLLQFIICLILTSCTLIKNDILPPSYDYSVSIRYLDKIQNLFIQPFELYEGAYQLGEKGIWFPTVGSVDDFTQKPYQELKLDWFELEGDVPKKFSKTIDITLPQQFTPERGYEINFYFYKGEVIVTYKYQSNPMFGRFSKNIDDYKEIYFNGILADPDDFKKYMDRNQNGTAEKFLEYIKKHKSHLIQPEVSQEYVERNKTIPKTVDQELLEKLSSENHKYCIMGEIVDPDGKIITDVTVLSKKSQNAKTKPFSQEKLFIKDGKFSLFSDAVFSWVLSFNNDKYYNTDVEIKIPDLIMNLSKGIVIRDENLLIKKVKVILYPLGNLNRDMITISNILKYSETNKVKKIWGIMLPYKESEEQKELLVANETELPNNFIYIVPGQDETGNYDGTIRLRTTVSDGGFLPLKYDDKHFFRNMQEAPQQGDYIPELIISEDWLGQNSIKFPIIEEDHTAADPAPYIVFYFKGVGLYGKGLIEPLEFKPFDTGPWINKKNADLKINFYINRNQNVQNTNCWINNNW